MQNLTKDESITEAKVFNLNFMYTDDAMTIKTPNIVIWIPVIYPQILEIKESSETAEVICLIFLTFRSNLTPMIKFLSAIDNITKVRISILPL